MKKTKIWLKPFSPTKTTKYKNQVLKVKSSCKTDLFFWKTILMWPNLRSCTVKTQLGFQLDIRMHLRSKPISKIGASNSFSMVISWFQLDLPLVHFISSLIQNSCTQTKLCPFSSAFIWFWRLFRWFTTPSLASWTMTRVHLSSHNSN